MGEASCELIAISYKVDAIPLMDRKIKVTGCIDPQASTAMGQVGPKGKTDEQPLSVLLYLYNEEMVKADASP